MKRTDYINWDEYFMGIALLTAMRSKDPSSQVGACIVSPENKILSQGKMHKTRPGSLAGRKPEISNEIFKNRLKCGIIFVKYATKAERMLRAAEMREKPI